MNPNPQIQQQQQQQQSVADIQTQSIDTMLQYLGQLENTGSSLFSSFRLVKEQTQPPPSLLPSISAQINSMTQTCQQMRNEAVRTSLQNIPVDLADSVFVQHATSLPRQAGNTSYPRFKDLSEVDAWAQTSVRQTGELFAERQRLTENVQAALSVPAPKQLGQ